ncbi:MAG TPA: hypothetical protein VN853_14245 [Polyangia bacterium]|jgi:hypothetical protein|nr:hypothetical protein [Polyangia bacterium]
MLASVVAGVLLLQSQAFDVQARDLQAPRVPPLDKIVVTAAPPLDTQRLADALRVYLSEFGIAVESAAPDQADDLRQRIADARRLGESVRAVAVIRAERGTPDEVDIELTDLATDKTLIATMPKAARDEDLYRTLALKIQALLRATLSEARTRLDPKSAVGRLVSEETPPAVAPNAPRPPGPLEVEAGYAALSLSASGVVLQGIGISATYSLPRRFDLTVGTAELGATHVSSGDVDAVVSLVPLMIGVRARWRKERVELSVGPLAEVAIIDVTASSLPSVVSLVPVHPSRDILLALGAEAELRLKIGGPAWGYLRASALGVLGGPRYDIEGVPVLDTTRLQMALGAGLGLRFP